MSPQAWPLLEGLNGGRRWKSSSAESLPVQAAFGSMQGQYLSENRANDLLSSSSSRGLRLILGSKSRCDSLRTGAQVCTSSTRSLRLARSSQELPESHVRWPQGPYGATNVRILEGKGCAWAPAPGFGVDWPGSRTSLRTSKGTGPSRSSTASSSVGASLEKPGF